MSSTVLDDAGDPVSSAARRPPALQPDPCDLGITSQNKADAKAMDRQYLFGTEGPNKVVPIRPTVPQGDIQDDTEGDIAA